MNGELPSLADVLSHSSTRAMIVVVNKQQIVFYVLCTVDGRVKEEFMKRKFYEHSSGILDVSEQSPENCSLIASHAAKVSSVIGWKIWTFE